MAAIVDSIKKSEAFYKKFRKVYKTIPPFYRALGNEAAIAYFRRIVSKRSTAHWHLDYGGVRFWFWRIWEDEGLRTNAGGVPNTCKSSGDMRRRRSFRMDLKMYVLAADG